MAVYFQEGGISVTMFLSMSVFKFIYRMAIDIYIYSLIRVRGVPRIPALIIWIIIVTLSSPDSFCTKVNILFENS